MARRQSALGERTAQAHRLAIVVAFAEQILLKAVELRELFVGRERRVIRDVVGDAHELVERQDDAAMARVDEPRRDGKILVAVALAGTQFASRGHYGPAFACTRPFQAPPFPTAYW